MVRVRVRVRASVRVWVRVRVRVRVRLRVPIRGARHLVDELEAAETPLPLCRRGVLLRAL